MTAEQLAATLRGRLRHYMPGSRLPGRGQLAGQFDVPDRVARAALRILRDEGLIATARGRESVVLAPPQQSKQLSEIIALPLNRPELYAFQETVLLGADRRCRQAGIPLSVIREQADAEDEVDLDDVEAVQEQTGASLDQAGWMFINQRPGERVLMHMETRRIPLVLVDDFNPNRPVNVVLFDVQRTMYQATETLLMLGHRRIAYVGGPFEDAIARSRRRGYELALARFGVQLSPNLVWDTGFRHDEEVGPMVRRRLDEVNERPTGLVVVDVPKACQVLFACEQLGIEVPADASIVCGGTTPHQPLPGAERLSHFDQGPREDLGRLAVEILLGAPYQSDPVQMLVGSQWREGETTAPPPSP